MVRTGRVAERGPDAPVLLADELLAGQPRPGLVPRAPHELVEVLGEGFGQAVGQSLDHDRAVVVVLGRESAGKLIHPEARRDGEGPDVIVGWGDEVRERKVRLVVAVIDLLPKHREADAVVERDVVAVCPRRPETVDASRLQPPPGLDLVEQLLGVAEELPRGRALRRAVEDGRAVAPELPRVEEEAPVALLAQRGALWPDHL